MPLYQFVITLAIVGLLLWLVNRFVPMQSQIKGILNGVVVIAVILWIASLYRVLLLSYISQLGAGPRLITAVITLVVVGLLLWLVNRFIPMQGQIKGILNGVVVIVVVLWLMGLFGLFGYISQFRVGH
ncbi:MAG TPA: Thivi_2564 family membrane protein [Terracidiphilus sp.]|nr:Thivi_2564 family membrane protein [Terracidiphilus sp.]